MKIFIGNYNNGLGIRAIDRKLTKKQYKKFYRVFRLMSKQLRNNNYKWKWYYSNLYRKVVHQEIIELCETRLFTLNIK